MRIVTNREATWVGKCIYCSSEIGRLGEEHVSPFGLNGCIVLTGASCRECERITCRIENHVLRHMWGPARAQLGYRTRDRGRSKRLYPLTVVKDGQRTERKVLLSDTLRVIELPIFAPPAALSGRAYTEGIISESKDSFVFEESKESLARRLGVDEVCPPRIDLQTFARFVGKVSYGYAIDRYGLDAFENVYLRPAILGTKDDIGMWVGSPPNRELPVRATPMSGGFKILPNNDVVVRIKLFPRLDGAEYVTVVGKMKSFHADQYRLLRKGSEAAAA